MVPPDGNSFAQFGEPIVIRDRLALIGDSWDDDQGTISGAAHLYDLSNPGNPAHLAEILPADPGEEYHFGYALDLDGDIALIGCLWHGERGFQAGAAYLFDVSNPSAPVQLSRFTGSDTDAGDNFSRSVALSGRMAVVGSPRLGGPGAVYVFDVSDPTLPVELAKFIPDDSTVWAEFGWSGAMRGNLALIGSIDDDTLGSNAGAAYLLDLSDPTNPVQLAKLLDVDGGPGELFGESVALSDDRALVGARYANEGAGSASLFDVSDPAHPKRIARLDPSRGGNCGVSVSLSPSLAIVGCPGWNGGVGAAFVFDASTGFGAGRVTAPAGEENSLFGDAVAITDYLALVGIPYDSPGFGAVSVSVACAANFNGDDQLDTRDVLDFLSAWTQERAYDCTLLPCSSDLNGDGRVDALDVLAFLNAWVKGCP